MKKPLFVTILCLLAAAAGFGAPAGAGKSAHIGYVYPAGGHQGSSFEITVGGENVYGVTTALVSGAGVSATILDSRDPDEGQLDPKRKNKKKNEAVIDELIKVKVTIASNAPVGDRDICLASPDRISNKLVFQVGELNEMREKEPNSKAKVAVPLTSLPVLVNGQIMPGDVDCYRFSALKGQRLVVDVAARALLPYIADGVPGWFQAIVSLCDAEGKEVAVADNFRFRQDPVLFYDVPRDGDYILSIRDTIYRGREDFVYRMRIGELPFITSLFPLGAERGDQAVPVSLSGVNLPTNTVLVPVDVPDHVSEAVSVTDKGLWSNTRLFAVGGIPESIEDKPALTERQARIVDLPRVVDGCLRKPGEKHFYRFEGSQDQSIRIEVVARRLGSPLDSYLALMDGHGQNVATNDDVKDKAEGFLTHQADSALSAVLPADGPYTVVIYDTQGGGGNEYAYRLRMGSPMPDFELRVTPAAVVLPQNGSALVTVYAIRRDGFDGEIRLNLADPASGLTLDAGVIPAGVEKITTTLSASSQVVGRVVPCIMGTAVISGKSVTHPAVAAENLMQAFLYQHLFPFHEETVLVTKPSAPFRVAFSLPQDRILKLVAGQETGVRVSVSRSADHKGPIRLQMVDAPKGISARNLFIGPDRDEIWVMIRAENKIETNRVGILAFTASMPVERPATSQEMAWKAAKAAREQEARKAAEGLTNETAVANAKTNNLPTVVVPDKAATNKPYMVTRQLVMTCPAVSYRLVDAKQEKQNGTHASGAKNGKSLKNQDKPGK